MTAGLGGMGGAQPLAVTMNEGVNITVEIDESKIDRRLETRYLDIKSLDFEEAVSLALKAKNNGDATSIGLLGNIVDILPKFIEKNIIDVLTDQTSAHDELNGYYPKNMSFEEAINLRNENPDKYISASYQQWVSIVNICLSYKKRFYCFDYGNNLRGQAKEKSNVKNAFTFPDLYLSTLAFIL